MKVSSPYPVLDNRPIDQWKVTELKEELKRRKLTIKGLKEDLIKRLDEAIRNENESAGGNTDNGSDGIPQPVLQTEESGTVPAVNESTRDTTDHGNEKSEVDGVKDHSQVDDIPQPMFQTEDGGTVPIVHEATGDMTDHGVEKNEVDGVKDQVQVDDIPQPVFQTEDGGPDPAVHATIGDMTDHGNEKNEVGGVKDQAQVDDTVLLGEGVREGEVTVGTDSSRDVENQEMVVSATSVETSITVNEIVMSEIAGNVQESHRSDSQNGKGDLESQLENEEVNPPHEDNELNSSDPNNQVSEVSTVLGFQVKSDSISSDCLSINEKNELKDNIIADNVKLELDVKPETVQPSSTNVVPDGGKLHPMDVEDPHENKVPVEEGDDNKADNAEMSKKNDNTDVLSSEKLNLDRSSGDDSMEEDALESKQIVSKYNPDEVVEKNEKTEVPVVVEKAPADDMQIDIPADKKYIQDENNNAPAAPTVKRKLHDQVVGNNETSKRQRRWNSENLKVPEPQSNIASSTTPTDMFPSTTLKRNFSRSNSAASEDAPKERVVPPSPKPPTNSLRIDRFLRPFTLKAVQELLGKTGTVASFWMDHQVVGNNETSKRQRRWNSENLKVPEPQSNIASSTTPTDMFPSTTLKRNFSRSNSAASEDAPKERVVPPSPKPPTNSLRIDRFLRPFTLKAVQELLGKTGTVASFWMDHIKTHCYVTYSSVDEAIETRNAVYNLQWPPNGGRLLVAEFVDPQEVKIRAEVPPQLPATPVGPGPAIPPTPVLQPPQPSPRQLVQRQQLPPPPPSPSPSPLPPPPPLSNPPQVRERLPLPPPPPLPEKVDPPIVTLDDLFRKTKATPRIYYLPLSDEQVAAKLKAQGKSTKQSAGVACRKELFQGRWYRRSRLVDRFGFFRRLLWVEARFKLGLEPCNLRFLPMPGQTELWFLLVFLSSKRSNFIELELLVANFLVDVILVFDLSNCHGYLVYYVES
ncbi:Apoptotic chromatin condensation inducer in the nucleus like [Actinidia chinensis var. chinensis]|uniref:Apoptotic chromatin condensation inducer in the nucleus like n=1 Tax=Actinidia chinensis var. chinensis TaxID=1590841 RepID=A0A2R6S376_ACTCC|nr:Apoptotic chromatin condensation inducer in the nucleus like [Actinidia chinensis var. chinensis]